LILLRFRLRSIALRFGYVISNAKLVRTVGSRRQALQFKSCGRRRFDSHRASREPAAGSILRFHCRDLPLADNPLNTWQK
jgi:hypothetical protein